jgi:thiamine transport system substrate-binding protein
MYVYPVNPNVVLPEEFTKYAQAPEQAASLPANEIAANRDQWIQAWTDVVLK